MDMTREEKQISARREVNRERCPLEGGDMTVLLVRKCDYTLSRN